MPTRVQRPGPLQELPIALFAPIEGHLLPPSSPFKKRARSPSVVASPMSPAKRRILNDEGILSVVSSLRSPERLTVMTSSSWGQLSPSRLHLRQEDGLSGMETPAPDQTHVATRPTKPRPQHIAIKNIALSSDHVGTSTAGKRQESDVGSHSPHLSISTSPPGIPLRHPADMLECADTHSPHYPGFDVYRNVFQPQMATLEDRIGVDDWRGEGYDCEDETKENFPPKKKSKTILLRSPSIKRIVGLTPNRLATSSPSAHRSVASPVLESMLPPSFTPGQTPGRKEILDRKRVMEREVDEVVDSDD